MVPLPPSAVEHYQEQQRITVAAVAGARHVWAGMRPTDLDRHWTMVGPRLTLLVAAAQLAAAGDAATATTATIAELGLPSGNEGRLDPAALAGVAADGRDLGALMYGAVVQARTHSQRGAASLDHGRRWLDMAVQTTVADTARAASSATIAVHPGVGGYVRQINPPACSRCVVQAGKWFRWNKGFKRHPRCDCRHIPASENIAGDLTTDPDRYFASLDRAQQDRAFTVAGADAIRLGANVGQIVNARRGALGLTPAGVRLTAAEAKSLRNGLDRGRLMPVNLHGRAAYVTTEGVTRRGLAGRRLGAWADGVKREGVRYRSAKTARIMPETIIEIARDREDAIRLLKRYGYLL